MRFGLCIILASVVGTFPVYGQGVAPVGTDTLKASHIISAREDAADAGTYIFHLPSLRVKVSPTGEYDAIKGIQTLPGVAAGAEGASAIYVRGGSAGNNVTTLDGVPVYGDSHLLGMASAIPTDILSSATFRSGGFQCDESNLTASHIDLRSMDGDMQEYAASSSISSFMASGTFSGPIIRDRVSLLGSVRISPLGPEYRLLQKLVGGPLDSLGNARAVAYDLFAKASYNAGSSQSASLSVFRSLDTYGFNVGESDHRMGWDNLIVHLDHSYDGDGWLKLHDGIYFNRFRNWQGILQEMSGTMNDLYIISSLSELSAEMLLLAKPNDNVKFQTGVSSRMAWFNPGSTARYEGNGAFTPRGSMRTDSRSNNFITSLVGQIDLGNERRWYHLMASAKANFLISNSANEVEASFRFNPEGSLLLSARPVDWIIFEGTADWAVQYYHTLEGMPLGWSLDVLIPSYSERGPESSGQLYGGFGIDLNNHHLKAGVFAKRMEGLVYFKDASRLFTSYLAGWNDAIEIGDGTSCGAEFLYDKEGRALQWHIAYTLSKTDRHFPTVNKGERFPAKFDRRHMLNTSLTWRMFDGNGSEIGFTTDFTFQSGNWETVAGGDYNIALPFSSDRYTIDFYTGTNNYRMPSYVRLDTGVYMTTHSRRSQTFKFGIYNLLNRHNPFIVTYSPESGEWRRISLLPIMPSFGYRVDF